MTEYKIVTARSLAVLVTVANDACREGWTPLGGPYQRVYGGGLTEECQAMTRDLGRRGYDPLSDGTCANCGKAKAGHDGSRCLKKWVEGPLGGMKRAEIIRPEGEGVKGERGGKGKRGQSAPAVTPAGRV